MNFHFSGVILITSWGTGHHCQRNKVKDIIMETMVAIPIFNVEFILFSEINRVRLCLFHNKGSAREPLNLPDKAGPIVTLSEKLYVPVKEHPDVSITVEQIKWVFLDN